MKASLLFLSDLEVSTLWVKVLLWIKYKPDYKIFLEVNICRRCLLEGFIGWAVWWREVGDRFTDLPDVTNWTLNCIIPLALCVEWSAQRWSCDWELEVKAFLLAPSRLSVNQICSEKFLTWFSACLCLKYHWVHHSAFFASMNEAHVTVRWHLNKNDLVKITEKLEVSGNFAQQCYLPPTLFSL